MSDTHYDGLGFGHFMPGTSAAEDGVFYAGEAIDTSKVPVAEKEAVADALRTVYDPEIPVNIYELGLVYDIDIDAAGGCVIKMTLTAPGCPVAGILPGQVAEAAASVDGIGEVAVHLVWDPPWTPDLMSDVAKVELDMF